MKISEHSKISTIIQHNEEAIEVIASVNTHFKKLKNPILRKVLAPRVTIGDAAKIGKCDVNDLLNALSKIGFEIEDTMAKPQESKEDNPLIKKAVDSGKVKSLDVRYLLSQGTDPFLNIMDVLKALPKGFVLEIINSFEPTPLIKILNKKGYNSTTKSDSDVVKTYFIFSEAEVNDDVKEGNEVFYVVIEDLEKEKGKFIDHCKSIDVRDLEMPLPMITILNELEELQKGEALYVDHKKVPQYLLRELAERKLITWISEIEEGNVKLLIHY